MSCKVTRYLIVYDNIARVKSEEKRKKELNTTSWIRKVCHDSLMTALDRSTTTMTSCRDGNERAWH